MKKALMLIGAVLVFIIALSACTVENALAGRWQYFEGDNIEYFGFGADLTFTSDGTLTEFGYNRTSKYERLEGNILRVTNDSDSAVYSFTYSVRGDSMTLTDSNGNQGTWKRNRIG